MKTIDVRFNTQDHHFNGTPSYTSKTYTYFITDAQADEIEAKDIKYAVVKAPGDNGTMKVVKIAGQPGSGKADRHIVSLVDTAAYEETRKRAAAIKTIKAKMEQRAAEIAEEQRLKALADAGDPIMKALMEELEQVK